MATTAPTTMSSEQREVFLAGVHVGVISVDQPGGRAPLAVPIWYAYDPAAGVTVVTDEASRKSRALEAAGRFSLVVQDEALPYRYVSVEGPVVDRRRPDADGLARLARRYLGEAGGAAYADATRGHDVAHGWAYTMRPERWFTADLSETLASFG